MKNYELLLMLSGRLKESDVTPAIGQVKELFTKFGVTIVDEAQWGRLRMAYEIKHERHANYVLWHVSMEPAKVDAFSKELQVADHVLRFLLIDAPTHGQTFEVPSTQDERAERDNKGSKGDEKSPRRTKAPAKAAPKTEVAEAEPTEDAKPAKETDKPKSELDEIIGETL